MSYPFSIPGDPIPFQPYDPIGSQYGTAIPRTGAYGPSMAAMFGQPSGISPDGYPIFDTSRGVTPQYRPSGLGTLGVSNPSSADLWNSYEHSNFPASNPSNPFGSRGGGYYEGGPGTEAYSNAQEWSRRPLSDGEYALRLRGVLANKVRDASSRGLAADALQKIQMFDRMTPQQAAGIYNRAPQTPQEATIQRTISDANAAGEQGFAMGYATDLANRARAQHQALFDRQIRAEDQAYQFKNAENIRQEKELADKLKSQKDELAQKRIDLQAQAQADRNQQVAQFNVEKAYRDAQIAVASGAAPTEADVYRMFPDLSDQKKAVLVGIVQNRNTELGQYNAQRQGLFDNANMVAEGHNQTLAAAKQQADADYAAQVALQNKSLSPSWTDYARSAVGLGPSDETIKRFSTALPPQRAGRTPAEQAIIDKAFKESRGNVIYDPVKGRLAPAPSMFLNNGSGGASQPPAVSYGDMNAAADREGGGPSLFGPSVDNRGLKPTGDYSVDQFNYALAGHPEKRLTMNPGMIVRTQNGIELQYDGRWFKPFQTYGPPAP